jgi:hypothetical protein
MTWREHYWNDAVQSPAYFREAEFATLLDGDYGTTLFGRWIEENHPGRIDLFHTVEYLLIIDRHGDDVEATLDFLDRHLPRPWENWVMGTALEQAAQLAPELPVEVRDDADFAVLADQLRDGYVFAFWRDALQQAAVTALSVPEVVPAFLAACHGLADEVRDHKGKGRAEESDDASGPDEPVAGSSGKRVRFAEPAEVVARRHPWSEHEFSLAVAFTMLPEANATLADRFTWPQAQAHLRQWGVDLDEVTGKIDRADRDELVKSYRDDRLSIVFMGEFVHLTVTIDSAVHAHNTGIIATLDTEGAYTHYVQFKDLVMFYTDESDMHTPLYNVLRTFGEPWAGGTAEGYVVRHGKGRMAHLAVHPVKVSHQDSVAAEVRRCSAGLPTRIMPPRPTR